MDTGLLSLHCKLKAVQKVFYCSGFLVSVEKALVVPKAYSVLTVLSQSSLGMSNLGLSTSVVLKPRPGIEKQSSENTARGRATC